MIFFIQRQIKATVLRIIRKQWYCHTNKKSGLLILKEGLRKIQQIDILELCSNDEWRQREMERLVLCSYLLWHRLVLIQMGFQREDISASLARVRNSLIYSGLQLSIRYGLTGRLPFFSSRDPLKKSTPTSMSFKDHFYGSICTIYIHIQKGGPSQPLLKNQFNVKPYLNLLEFAHFYFLFYKTHDQVL